MGWLDKAKKLAEQAREKAEDTIAEVKARTDRSHSDSGRAQPYDDRMGTPYVPGMLGKPGWREQGLIDPAALLPIADRDRAGIPHSTKSRILEEPYGMGRRWTSGERSAGLFYRLTPEHQAWTPPTGLVPDADADGAMGGELEDGSTVVFLGDEVVLETKGLVATDRSALFRAVAAQMGG